MPVEVTYECTCDVCGSAIDSETVLSIGLPVTDSARNTLFRPRQNGYFCGWDCLREKLDALEAAA